MACWTHESSFHEGRCVERPAVSKAPGVQRTDAGDHSTYPFSAREAIARPSLPSSATIGFRPQESGTPENFPPPLSRRRFGVCRFGSPPVGVVKQTIAPLEVPAPGTARVGVPARDPATPPSRSPAAGEVLGEDIGGGRGLVRHCCSVAKEVRDSSGQRVLDQAAGVGSDARCLVRLGITAGDPREGGRRASAGFP